MAYVCGKWIFFTATLLFWLAGVASIALGTLFLVSEDVYNVVTEAGIEFYFTGSYILLAAGGFMFVVGWFGCIGAWKNSMCLLTMFITSVFAIIALELAVGIWAIVSFDSLHEVVDTGLNTTLNETGSLYNIQQSLSCCGLAPAVDGDYPTPGCLSYPNGTTLGCECNIEGGNDNCVDINQLEGCTDQAGSTFIYKQACNQPTYDLIYNNLIWIAVIGFVLVLVEIFALSVSFNLCCKIRRRKTTKAIRKVAVSTVTGGLL